jgi:thiol-disulfide isomerase/thioredoxin
VLALEHRRDPPQQRPVVLSFGGFVLQRVLFLVVTLSPSVQSWAADAAAEDVGLSAGRAAPPFLLPVVNDFVPSTATPGALAGKTVKWGPAKWTGEKPEEAKKLVVMSFFATYCEPCKKEMPELARLYDSYKDQGLGVLLVSIDKGDEQKEQIVALARENGVRFPVVHDRFQVVARRYAADRLPYMLLLDGNATVKAVHVGYTEELRKNLENELREHLGLGPSPLPPGTPPPSDRGRGIQEGKSPTATPPPSGKKG